MNTKINPIIGTAMTALVIIFCAGGCKNGATPVIAHDNTTPVSTIPDPNQPVVKPVPKNPDRFEIREHAEFRAGTIITMTTNGSADSSSKDSIRLILTDTLRFTIRKNVPIIVSFLRPDQPAVQSEAATKH